MISEEQQNIDQRRKATVQKTHYYKIVLRLCKIAVSRARLYIGHRQHTAEATSLGTYYPPESAVSTRA